MKVIYIAGYGRSGSTVLELVLANMAGAVGLGEFCRIYDDAISGRVCSCGSSISTCRFWSEFVPEDIQEISILQEERKRLEGISGLFARERTTGNYRRNMSEILEALDKNYESVIDSSKMSRGVILRLLTYRRMGYEVQVIHLVRGYKALLSSLMKGSNSHLEEQNSADSRPGHLFLFRSFLGAWIANLGAVIVPGVLGFHRRKIRYEDFILYPTKTLSLALGRHVDVDFRDIKIGHAIGGNRLVKNATQSISLDDSFLKERKSVLGRIPKFYLMLFSTLKLFEC